MQLIVCKTADEAALRAAALIAEQIRSKPDSVLGLPTGSTPIGVYSKLSSMYAAGELDFSRIVTFNLDEYLPIAQSDPNSYCAFMHRHLWDKVNLAPENTHIPCGEIEIEDAEDECRRYDAAIKQAGGLDLQLLGVGRNGHIGFNEPNDFLQLPTHAVTLTESTLEANSPLFENPDDIPRHAISAGLGSIFGAKKIILIALGKDKKAALSAILNNTVTTDAPASLLKLHPDLTVICDTDAYEQ